MRFPLVKLIDFRDKKEYIQKPENSTSPMAMVVRAQLKSYSAKKDDNNKKFNVKWELIRQCCKRGYKKRQIYTLLKFIDWIIRLPEDFEARINEKIIKLEEENKMPYVTSWERMAKEDGVNEGKIKTAINLRPLNRV